MKMPVIITIAVGVPIFAFSIMYNILVAKKNQIQNAFSSIDAMLQKRYNLIPNLVSTVKAYMEHERSILQEITELRTKAMSTDISHDEMLQLNEAISEVLEQITIAIENYPELKASNNFLQLQAALNEIEEQVSAARRAYNAAVTDFNNSVLMFPTNIVARITGFKPTKVFKISHHESESKVWYNS